MAAQGARVVASDISLGMLQVGREIDERAGRSLPMVQADAGVLPFADDTFDIAFSAYGAVPFIADTASLMRELARVMRPGGRLAFSTTHPFRWAFPDVPDTSGLVAQYDYFDTTPYVERSGDLVTYVEHHRTFGGRIREMVAAGLTVEDVVEPTWPDHNKSDWGGWSATRGKVIGHRDLSRDEALTAARSGLVGLRGRRLDQAREFASWSASSQSISSLR